MELETNRKYRVTSKTGKAFEGYVQGESYGTMVVHVFSDCFRVITSQLGPNNYTAVPPKTTYIAPRFLIATVPDPVLIEPLELTPIDDLPYGAVQNGSWYCGIRVPYTPIPENVYAAR